jgi:hypothetical protein
VSTGGVSAEGCMGLEVCVSPGGCTSAEGCIGGLEVFMTAEVA